MRLFKDSTTLPLEYKPTAQIPTTINQGPQEGLEAIAKRIEVVFKFLTLTNFFFLPICFTIKNFITLL